MVAETEIPSRIQYLQTLPNLVKQVRALDQKAAEAYRMWRQALGQPDGEEQRIQFRKLDHKLQQIFPKFCYQAKVVQEMIESALRIDARFRASQDVVQKAGQSRNLAWQMTLVDVERQTMATMEEFVRMPCEVFLRNCIQLKTAALKFQQARCEMIQDHLRMVASIAGTYANRGLALPQLIREGIFGLIRALEKFGYQNERGFSPHAARRIRQSISDALAAKARLRQNFPRRAAREANKTPGITQEEPPLQVKAGNPQ